MDTIVAASWAGPFNRQYSGLDLWGSLSFSPYDTPDGKYDKRIGESDSERCDKIVKIRPLAGRYRTNGLHRITAECIDTEYQQQDTPEQLQIEDILVDIIEYETHSVACQQSIGNITQRGAYTGHKTIPTPFVQSTLNAQYSYGAQRCRYDNTYYEPFP